MGLGFFYFFRGRLFAFFRAVFFFATFFFPVNFFPANFFFPEDLLPVSLEVDFFSR